MRDKSTRLNKLNTASIISEQIEIFFILKSNNENKNNININPKRRRR